GIYARESVAENGAERRQRAGPGLMLAGELDQQVESPRNQRAAIAFALVVQGGEDAVFAALVGEGGEQRQSPQQAATGSFGHGSFRNAVRACGHNSRRNERREFP